MLSASNAVQALDFKDTVVAFAAEPLSLQAVFKRQPIEHLDAGECLFFEGDAAKHLFEVIDGVLRLFKIMPDGRRVITGFLYAGDLIGLSLKNHYLYSAEAVIGTKFRRCGRKAFDEAVTDSPQLRPQLFARLCDEMAAAQDQMVLLSCKSAEERLCSFLLQQLRRKQRHDRATTAIDLPMTRLDIADHLGLTIETVSRTMTKLANKGILGSVGRHSIRVLKPVALAHLAGDGDECDDKDAQSVIAFGGKHPRH